MDLKPIRTKKDYQAERLWDAPAKSHEADRLDVLAMLIEDYERQHYSIPDPDPIDPAVKYVMPECFSRVSLSLDSRLRGNDGLRI